MGTTRFDGHVGLQEAFGEVKLADFGPNYDFINLRVGIQQFVSDFRGFIFADEQPGARFFGNLRSNRFQWNLAGFDLLEKNTNSGLNTFARRGREVAIANIFIQDFFAKGYTRSSATTSSPRRRPHALRRQRLSGASRAAWARSALHRIDADYFGWTGDGHIGRINLTHAFYEVWGTDTLQPDCGPEDFDQRATGGGRVLADYSYMRFRTSFLYASGDDKPRDSTARGFSSIVDAEAFAGGEFSSSTAKGSA
jgi:hypothetical protein